MKKYIINNIEFKLQGKVPLKLRREIVTMFHSEELDLFLSEQTLIKLGATEVKEDEWEDMVLKKGEIELSEKDAILTLWEGMKQLIKNQQHLKRRLDELDTNK